MSETVDPLWVIHHSHGADQNRDPTPHHAPPPAPTMGWRRMDKGCNLTLPLPHRKYHIMYQNNVSIYNNGIRIQSKNRLQDPFKKRREEKGINNLWYCQDDLCHIRETVVIFFSRQTPQLNKKFLLWKLNKSRDDFRDDELLLWTLYLKWKHDTLIRLLCLLTILLMLDLIQKAKKSIDISRSMDERNMTAS